MKLWNEQVSLIKRSPESLEALLCRDQHRQVGAIKQKMRAAIAWVHHQPKKASSP